MSCRPPELAFEITAYQACFSCPQTWAFLIFLSQFDFWRISQPQSWIEIVHWIVSVTGWCCWHASCFPAWTQTEFWRLLTYCRPQRVLIGLIRQCLRLQPGQPDWLYWSLHSRRLDRKTESPCRSYSGGQSFPSCALWVPSSLQKSWGALSHLRNKLLSSSWSSSFWLSNFG